MQLKKFIEPSSIIIRSNLWEKEMNTKAKNNDVDSIQMEIIINRKTLEDYSSMTKFHLTYFQWQGFVWLG